MPLKPFFGKDPLVELAVQGLKILNPTISLTKAVGLVILPYVVIVVYSNQKLAFSFFIRKINLLLNIDANSHYEYFITLYGR